MGLEDEELRTITPLLPTILTNRCNTGPNNKRKEELLCLDDEEECRTPSNRRKEELLCLDDEEECRTPSNRRKEELLCLDDEEECRTPRRLLGDGMLSLAPLVCPPAPRKARQASYKKLRPPSQGFFKVPDDLASVFMVLPSPLKKIRTS